MKVNPLSISLLIFVGVVSCDPLPVEPAGQAQNPYLAPYQQGAPDPRFSQDPRYSQNPQGALNQAYGQQAPAVPPVVTSPPRDTYPTAERTDHPDRVLSPYDPYNVIDVQGFRSGQLAKDPSNGKIFRIP